jgi:hypothetical protein
MVNLTLKASFFQSMAIYSVKLRSRLMTYWQQVKVKQFIVIVILLEFTYWYSYYYIGNTVVS